MPDIFGGREGSQAHRINAALLAAAPMALTATQIADRINEPRANVSAQLSWLFGRGLISRNANRFGGGRTRDRFAYYYSTAQNIAGEHVGGVVPGAPNDFRRRYTGTPPTYVHVDDPYASNSNRSTADQPFTAWASRPFGIEIECFLPGTDREVAQQGLIAAMREIGIVMQYHGYTHVLTSHWKLVTDASLYATRSSRAQVGIEIVSPILRGAEGELELAKVLDALQRYGARVNSSCGLHVHHDHQGFDNQRKLLLYQTYGKLERFIDAFMPPSRRGTSNMMCQSCATVSYGNTRYTKLNAAMNERTHQTIEFRQHSGTIEKAKILPWIAFTRAMVNCLDLNQLGDATSLELMLLQLELTDADRAYFIRRTQQLRSAQDAAEYRSENAQTTGTPFASTY